MARCRTVQDNLTAWIDGELSPRWERKVGDHVSGCAACASEADSLRRAVALHAQLLPDVVRDGAVPSPALWTRIAARAAEAETVRLPWLGWMRPLLTVAAVVVLSLVGFVSAAGGPQAVLIPLGVKAPPPAVKRAPAMFTQYEMIEKLEMLENFDTVDTLPLDENDAGKG